SHDPLRIKDGKSVSPEFTYNSATNKDWMTRQELLDWLKANKQMLGKI
ncbi:UDP-N-acetylglucosamine 4,6-dehydratase (inverting), partial [archaeon]|nr:UDP-N-acetylglucosamine 4,6-dehydratase (inverting) [archaeon]NDB55287.1 UDP-N-acetylglucosamine 4,6-dehydratase (inverting) [archaeon]NDB79143.1 UDP-N-acetylglucosamine 4,6-dehydratase (inverting) [archaeon]